MVFIILTQKQKKELLKNINVMAKIDFKHWGTELPFIKFLGGYRNTDVNWGKNPINGRKGWVQCPCCSTATDIYIWSFVGCGKRCNGCNVLLTYGSAFVYDSETTDEFFNKINIIQNGKI